MKKSLLLFTCLLLAWALRAENGYRLWLRYEPVKIPVLLAQYRSQVAGFHVAGNSATVAIAKKELAEALTSLLGKTYRDNASISNRFLLAGTPASSPEIAALSAELSSAGKEGFLVKNISNKGRQLMVIAGNTDVAVLYGVFHFLRLLQTNQPLAQADTLSVPKIALRMLNHWDNLTRYVERGYAGISIWDWQRLPGYLDQRYTDYARANASIGINATVLTNVNANAMVLTPMYLEKVAALASLFRPYGIKVFLTARFSAPIESGKMKTADPLDTAVQRWWRNKADEIYRYIPDFGGFVVKANSEGQPGPQNYHRNHAEGANMLADALAPHGGTVIWRAFVYSDSQEDRFKKAYDEFQPLDGSFRSNVLVQVKNGPIDFQPREPFHPLFGAMPKTPLVMEFQLTQEYLGFASHLVFLPTMFKEILDADTYEKGPGSTVAKVVEGQTGNHAQSGMAGVANIGSDINWTGHPFGQANWYAMGRLSWNPGLRPETIAEEWTRQTFGNEPKLVKNVVQMMMISHEAVVNYMTPLGLHHIMGYGHHYGPAPWYNKGARADWNPTYFHQADSMGIGFNRTASGSNALAQYAPEVARQWMDSSSCPDEYLLWFHHVSWTHKMQSGRTLWDELCKRYNDGVDSVVSMQQSWKAMEKMVDAERYAAVSMLLAVQQQEAKWWRNACLLYFQTFSRMAIPAKYEQPDHTLEYYKSLSFPYAPGNGQ